MAYFEITIDQTTYCGCWETLFMEFPNEQKAYEWACDNAYDVLIGMIDDDEDEEEWVDTITINIEEITEKEFLQQCRDDDHYRDTPAIFTKHNKLEDIVDLKL